MKKLINYDNIAEAVANLDTQFAAHISDGALPEACGPINDASRGIVAAVIKVCGHAYIAQINRSTDEQKKPVFVYIEAAAEVKNFDGSWVFARPDPDLEKLLLEREAASYSGMRDDAKRIDAITDRAVEIGGLTLIWT
jgi:hypothetical protein